MIDNAVALPISAMAKVSNETPLKIHSVVLVGRSFSIDDVEKFLRIID